MNANKNDNDEKLVNAVRGMSKRSFMEGHKKGAKDACNALIDTFRAIAFEDTADPRTFTAVQVVDILKDMRDGAESQQQQEEESVIVTS